jgi:outer membrane protein insertion porin family
MHIDKAGPSDASGASNRDVLEHDLLLVQNLYYDRGYITAHIDTPTVEPAADGSFIAIRLHIDEGPRFRIGKINVGEFDAKGQPVSPPGGQEHLRALVSIREGDWFNRSRAFHDFLAIERLYRDLGYAHVDATPRTKLDTPNKVVDLTIPIHRGPLVSIARIAIEGNAKVSSDDIKKALGLTPGELYGETKIEQAKKRLLDLGTFSAVYVSIGEEPDPTRVTLTFEVKEK